SANQLSFTNNDKKRISITDYFKTQHSTQLQYPYLPCVNRGNARNPIYIPLELCSIIPGQHFIKDLNPTLTTQMIQVTYIKIADKSLEINSRVLDLPKLTYGDSQAPNTIYNGSWNLQELKLLYCPPIKNWCIITFSQCSNEEKKIYKMKIEEKIRVLIETGTKIGIANNVTFNNLFLKINIKNGGRSHHLSKTSTPFIYDSPTIIMGADITHQVQNLNGIEYNQYPCVQGGRIEIIQDIKTLVTLALKDFKNNTNQKLQQIIFYRDGVSEGQFEQVFDNEVKAIKDACSDLSDFYKPKLTVVIVQKRHHIRFALIDPKHDDNKTVTVYLEQ
ncbi:17443_t:CDS:2, partial [Dentiscutata heterogama]